MLSQEEIKFNQAKKRFEMLKKKWKEAEKHWDVPDWYLDNYYTDIHIFTTVNWLKELSTSNRDYILDDDMQESGFSEEEYQKLQYEYQEIEGLITLYFDLMIARKELIRCEDVLSRRDPIIQSEEFLDRVPEGKSATKEVETSVLDNYRNWGIRRICLDGFQNHLPADSKGTKSFLHFLVDDKWVSREEAMKQKDKIKKVRFADDGVGYGHENLKYLSSQKSSEDLSAGQFGEGLKLISMASVNLGLGMEVQSQNWIAIPFGKDVKIPNFRNNGKKVEDERKQLTWNVSEFDGEPIKRFENHISYTYPRIY